MRRIPPAPEPQRLTAYRRSAERLPEEERHSVAYGHLPDEVRQALQAACYESQQGRCAYCDRRIRRHIDDGQARYEMKIEHWAPQSENPAIELVWSNLLAVCPGGEGADEQHCDSRKGNRPLHLHPKRPGERLRFWFRADVANRERFPLIVEPAPDAHAVETEITPRDPAVEIVYGVDGKLSGRDEDVQDDLDNILNLNAAHLKRARFEAIRAVIGQIRNDWTAAEYERAVARALTVPFGAAPAAILRQRLDRRHHTGTLKALPYQPK